MLNIEKIKEIENNYIKSCGGYWNITEGNWKQNTISRTYIRALKSKYGKCFIGKINIYDKEDITNRKLITEYKKGMIYNFACNFVLPEYNKELEEMIREYNTPDKNNNKKNIMKTLDNIFNKIHELNGITLNWV